MRLNRPQIANVKSGKTFQMTDRPMRCIPSTVTIALTALTPNDGGWSGYARAAAEGAMVGGLVALAVVMLAVGSSISDELSNDWIALIGLVLAVVPAVLWLGVFRQLDRLEAEPHSFLFSTLVLGALFAGTVDEPLRRGLLDLHTWRPDNWFYSILVQTLTQGIVQATTVYVVVRYTVYLTDEFDERADGIIYGTAAGLGIADENGTVGQAGPGFGGREAVELKPADMAIIGAAALDRLGEFLEWEGGR